MSYSTIKDAVKYLQSEGIDNLDITVAFGKAQDEYKNTSVHGYSHAAEERYIAKRMVELLGPKVKK